MNHANSFSLPRLRRANIASIIPYLVILLSVLLAAEVFVALARIVYLQIITFHPLPHLDEWRTMILFSRMEREPDSWSLLLVPHAEHRPLLPRLIFLLDAKLAHGTGALSLVAIDCLLLGLVAIWACLLTANGRQNDRMQLAIPYLLALCIASLLFSGQQMSNFLRGFQVAMFMLYFFATLAFAAFAFALRRSSTRPVLLIVLACSFAVCAAFSLGNGLIVLPLLFTLACLRRRELPAGTILFIGIMTVVTIAAYVYAPGSILGVLGRTDYKLAPGRIGELAGFFLAFLGSPWASIAPDGVAIAGVITLLLSAYAMLEHWRRDRLRSYELVSAGLIVLALGSAAVVSLARLRFGIGAATESRYSTTVLMLYVAILVAFWPRFDRDAEADGSSRQNTIRTGALALFVFATLAYGVAGHWKFSYDFSQFPDMKADAEVAYLANVQDPLPFQYVAPQPQLELSWQARPYVLRHHLSVFSTAEAQSIGRPLTDVFRASDDQCIGRLDQVERVISGSNGGFRVSGWAWDTSHRSVPRTALLVEDGIVKGIGRFIKARPDVVTAVPEVRAVKNGFAGYVPRRVAKVTAYVLHRDQASVCRIPGELALPSE